MGPDVRRAAAVRDAELVVMRARALAAGALVAGVGALAAAAVAQAVTITYATPCTSETFTVPAGVTSVAIEARGAQGGAQSYFGGEGGLGGAATATLTVVLGRCSG